MTEHEVDVVVIGLGPGGEHAAGQLAEAGLPVAGVEARLVGGECPYWGCVPSKMMIRAANLLAEGRRIPGMAGASVVRPDWAPVASRIRAEATDNWDDQVAADRFTGQGGRCSAGTARSPAPGRVAVGDDVLRARRGIVIDTGTAPVIPPVPGLAGTPYWTNHEAIEAEQVPESLIVLGGGAIGVGAGPGLLPLRRRGHGGRGRRAAAPGRGAGGRGRCSRRCSAARASACGPARKRSGWPTSRPGRPRRVHRDARRRQPRSPDPGCSSPPDGAPTWPRSAPAASGSTSPSPRCRSTITCARRPGCGRSATWSARATSRTCPTTTRTSWSPTSSAGSIIPPSTTRCRGSPSPTRRSARSA